MDVGIKDIEVIKKKIFQFLIDHFCLEYDQVKPDLDSVIPSKF